jgi:DNA-binding protein HU-beta
MNKQQLIEKIAAEAHTTKALAELVLNCAIENIKKTVKKGDDVKIVGFGTFTKAKRKARTGRNPQTGKAIKIPASWAPKFRAGSEFKALVK